MATNINNKKIKNNFFLKFHKLLKDIWYTIRFGYVTDVRLM